MKMNIKKFLKESSHRSLYVIANEIYSDWKNVNYAAKPYLNAMMSLSDINDRYGFDSARNIVAYFLSNASSWRGPKAKEIKKELNKMLKEDVRFKLKTLLIEAGQSAGKMELLSTLANKAKQYAEELNLDIPGFEENYKIAQKKASLGKTQRKDMPVIDDVDVKEFQDRLKKGNIDINKPFSKTFDKSNPFPSGLNGYDAKDFLERGLKDGTSKDDIIPISIKKVAVKNLNPIQKQIYADKSIASIGKNGIEKTKNFLQNKTFFITSSDNFIIDGHHRFLSGLLLDPNLKVNTLSIDLPINKLLPMSIAYGDAIGNKRNA